MARYFPRLLGGLMALLGWVHLAAPVGPDPAGSPYGRSVRSALPSISAGTSEDRMRRERRLRRELSNLGYRLVRGRGRMLDEGMGGYLVFDLTADRVVLGGDPVPFTSDLDAVAGFLAARVAEAAAARRPPAPNCLRAEDCRQARIALGWSSHSLSVKAGVSPTVVSRLERGDLVTPAESEAVRLALEVGGTTLADRPAPRNGFMQPKLAAHQDALRDYLAANPQAKLAELKAWIQREHGAHVSIATVWRAVRQLDPPVRLGRQNREGPAPETVS